MVTIKNGSIMSSIQGLNELMKAYLPVQGAIKVRKMYKILTDAWEVFEDVRRQLVDQHGLKDKDGNPVTETNPDGSTVAKIDPTRQTEFQKAWEELLATEVEVPVTLTSRDLGEDFQIKPQTLMTLGELLQD